MILEVLLPVLLLGGLGWAVPRLLARVVPEGVGPLLGLALASTLLLIAASAVMFGGLYVVEGAPLAALPAAWPHLVRMGLLSALVWAPIMLLTVAALPRRWTEETW